MALAGASNAAGGSSDRDALCEDVRDHLDVIH
jgi:hypothetical protein